MPGIVESESRPRVIDADFSDKTRLGDRIVRQFEGTLYQYPVHAEKAIGALALYPAGKNLRTTVEASFDASDEKYILPIGNSNYGIQSLEAEPLTLLNRALSEGEKVTEL